MLKLQPSARRMGLIACGAVLSATLAACGHSGGDSSPPPPTPSPVAQFIKFVSKIVNKGAADTAEPTDISGVKAATTETGEPARL